MAKKIFIVTQKEVVNTIGGAITSFINIAEFLSEKYDVYGICYSEDKGEPDLDKKVKFVNLYNYYSDEMVEPYVGFDTDDKQAIETALDTMRKYQKIEEILKDIPYGGEATVRRIQEVIDNGID